MESKRKRDILFCRKVLILKAGGVGRWRPFSVAVGSYVNLVPGVAQGFKTQIAEIGGRRAGDARPRHARRGDSAWENRSSCWDRHPAENLSVWE